MCKEPHLKMQVGLAQAATSISRNMSRRKWREARKPFEASVGASCRLRRQYCCCLQSRGHRRMLAQSCSKCSTEEAISCPSLWVRPNRSSHSSAKRSCSAQAGCLYAGENESSALLSELQRLPSVSLDTAGTGPVDLQVCAPQSALLVFQGRPITHDLMKNSLEALGYRVSRSRLLTVFKMLKTIIHFFIPSGDKGQDHLPTR